MARPSGQTTPPQLEAAAVDEIAQLDDPTFLAERRRVREAMAAKPNEELAERCRELDAEFDRRARRAWTASQ
jgi:hypothetical protein